MLGHVDLQQVAQVIAGDKSCELGGPRERPRHKLVQAMSPRSPLGRFTWPSCLNSPNINRRSITTASGASQASSSDAVVSRFAPIPHRGFISVTGSEPNLSTFLNGILSTQVTPIVGNDSVGFYTTFLNRHVSIDSVLSLVFSWRSRHLASLHRGEYYMMSSSTRTPRHQIQVT